MGRNPPIWAAGRVRDSPQAPLPGETNSEADGGAVLRLLPYRKVMGFSNLVEALPSTLPEREGN